MSWGTRKHSRTCLDLLQTQHAASEEVEVHAGREAAALPHVSGLAPLAAPRIPGNNVRAKTPSFKDDLLPESSKCGSAAEGPSSLGMLGKEREDLPLSKVTLRLQGFLKVKSWK